MQWPHGLNAILGPANVSRHTGHSPEDEEDSDVEVRRRLDGGDGGSIETLVRADEGRAADPRPASTNPLAFPMASCSVRPKKSFLPLPAGQAGPPVILIIIHPLNLLPSFWTTPTHHFENR